MAQKNLKSKQKNDNKNASAEKAEKKSINIKNQTFAILIFASAILLFFITIVSGENIWNILHKFTWGIFGKSAILWPFLLIYVSIIASSERSINQINNKIFMSISVIITLCTAIFVFQKNPHFEITSYFKQLGELYANGMQGQGGGIFSGILGIPLICAVGIIGARILILISLFVTVMFLTGTSLINLFKYMRRPINFTVNTVNEKIENKKQQKPEKLQKNRINIDIPLPQYPNTSPDPSIIENDEKTINNMQNSNEGPQPDISAIEAAMAFTEKQKKKKKEPVVPMELHMEEVEKNNYRFPAISLLNESSAIDEKDITEELQINGQMLVGTLQNFGVQTKITNISRGPTVTRYELQPAAGVKISKITNLADDIALNLAASGVRIEAPIPGKAAVGIEIPNKIISVVRMRELILSEKFQSAESKLTVILGRDIAGNAALADLAKMPHLLIAGSTGSGKSVCINSFIVSLLYKATPNDVRFLMIDPKVVELGIYNGIPHLLVPVVTDPRKAAGALSWAVNEMLKRYKIFAENNVRDLFSYNKMVNVRLKKQKEDTNSQKPSSDENSQKECEQMPQIVIIIDELADLMMAAPNEVEDSICRLAQMARAAGMHLVIATQRPSVDVITGIIKANIPSRIALAVSSQIDSRTILDSTGAEKLLGRGDMLFSPIGVQKPIRVQGCYVTDNEIEAVINFIKQTQINDYDQDVIEEIEKNAVIEKNSQESSGEADDPMLQEAIKCIIEAGQASTSLLQRKLRLGYARAGRLIDAMEQKGIIGPYEGSKPRQILISKQQWLEKSLIDNSTD
ncbi:MAG: DNA translocase FtsK [Oscillospiraceae bacterium]|nr:DNA translocase FtsK [Oscillospiraceae bacterium]